MENWRLLMDTSRTNQFDIEKEIYNTQWNNIRLHWNETIGSIRYLSTLIVFAIIPLKFLRVNEGDTIAFGVDAGTTLYVKAFIMVVIGLLGLLTFLNQYNHFKRSEAARNVVVRVNSCYPRTAAAL
jgi:hypothetical protein